MPRIELDSSEVSGFRAGPQVHIEKAHGSRCGHGRHFERRISRDEPDRSQGYGWHNVDWRSREREEEVEEKHGEQKSNHEDEHEDDDQDWKGLFSGGHRRRLGPRIWAHGRWRERGLHRSRKESSRR